MNEGFIRREEAVPSGEQIAFEHAFHRVLAEHFDDPPVGRQLAAIRVFRKVFGDPEFLADFVDVVQLVRRVFVRAKDAEAIHVQLHHIAQESSQRPRVLGFDLTGLVDLQAVLPEVGSRRGFFEESAVGVRVRAHPASPGRRQLSEFRESACRPRRTALRAFVRASTLRAFSGCSGFFLTSASGTWCARQKPSSLWPSTSSGALQPFGVRSTIIGQRGRVATPGRAGFLLSLPDLRDAVLERRGHRLVHALRIRTFHEIRRPAVAFEQVLQLPRG